MRARRVCVEHFWRLQKKWDLSDVNEVKKKQEKKRSRIGFGGRQVFLWQSAKRQNFNLMCFFTFLNDCLSRFAQNRMLMKWEKYICRSRTQRIAFLRTLFSVQCVKAWHFGSRINETKNKDFFIYFKFEIH